MKTTFAAAALFAASSVSAQSTSVCPAINILESCLATTQGYLDLCPSTTDYQCLCDKWTAIVSCFDNCPTDSRASSFGNNKTLYCMNASLYATTTSAPKPTGTQSTSAAAAATTTTDAESSGTPAASSSTSTPKPTGTGAATNLAVSAGGILAAVAAVVAAVL